MLKHAVWCSVLMYDWVQHSSSRGIMVWWFIILCGMPGCSNVFRKLTYPDHVFSFLPDSSLWKLPLMLYTKDAIREPLTTLPSEELQSKAVELFKVSIFIMHNL